MLQTRDDGVITTRTCGGRDIRYIGKETDRKWEEGDDVTVLEFTNTEYGRVKRVVVTALAAFLLGGSVAQSAKRTLLRLVMMIFNMGPKVFRKEALVRSPSAIVVRKPT
jgi:hypothetical protein